MRRLTIRPWRPRTRALAIWGAVTLAVAGLVGVGCVHDGAEPGPLSGPSALALSLRLSATPDILPLDGAAQSIVTVTAQNDKGQPVSGLTLTVQIVNGPFFEDLGKLSSRSVVTDASGRAVFAYTAPLGGLEDPGAPVGAGLTVGGTVAIRVTPSSDNFANNLGRSVDIRLVPPGTVIRPFGAQPGFQFTPGTPSVFDQIRFSAEFCGAGDNTSTDCTRDPNGVITKFSWEFGDGETATGQEVAHSYEKAGTYLARLIVSDSFNRSASTTQTVSVDPGSPPIASFSFSPTAPSVDDTVFFDASNSRPGAGRTIVSYDWNFGDGTTATGVTTSHKFTVEDTYNVTLKLTDDKGQTGVSTVGVTVSDSLPVAVITFSPQSPAVGQKIFFSAEQSTVTNGRRIVGYRWIWGDGTATTDGPNTTKIYSVADDYVIQLFVTDDFGETGMTTQNISIGTTGDTVNASFTVSPTNPDVNDTVTFNASASTASPGATITSYAWNFGAGTGIVTETDPITSTTYSSGGSFIVTLTITDSLGNTDTTTETVAVASSAPSASFTVSPSSAGTGVAINVNGGASTPSTGETITMYEWDYGNGTVQTTLAGDPTDTLAAGYAVAGTYTITLTVTDSSGATATATQTVTIS